MESSQGIEAVCRLIGFHEGYPIEFRLAAITIAIICAIGIAEAIMEHLG